MKIYIILLTLCCLSFTLKAQSKSKLSRLQENNWISEDGTYYIKFNSYTFFRYFKGSNGFPATASKDSFHLGFKTSVDGSLRGETVKVIFNPKDIGVKAEGNYVVTEHTVFVIQELTDKSLILTPMTLGGKTEKFIPYTGKLPADFPE